MGKHSTQDDTERLFVSYYMPKHDRELDDTTREFSAIRTEEPVETRKTGSGVLGGVLALFLLVLAALAVLIGVWLILLIASLVKDVLILIILGIVMLWIFTPGA